MALTLIVEMKCKEAVVWGNEEVEGEAALRERLFKPLKKQTTWKKPLRGAKKSTLIVL